MGKEKKKVQMATGTIESVLVTGATGFIGRHLVPALLDCGYKVTCLHRGDPGPGLWADCRMVQGDIIDRESVRQAVGSLDESKVRGRVGQSVSGCDAVIHAAAVIDSRRKLDFDRINVEGTRILVEQAKKAKTKHFVFISTVDIGHKTGYGKSKEEGEKIVKESGLPFTILRPGPVYGEGDDKNIMQLFELVKKSRFIPVIGSGNSLRQPIHVDDVVLSIIRVLNSPKAIGRTYYLGGQSITYNEILSALIEASDNRPTVVHLPAGLAKVLVLALNKFGLGPVMNPEQLKTIDEDKIGDVKSFERDFGPYARPFRQGFTSVAESIRSDHRSMRSDSRSASVAWGAKPKKKNNHLRQAKTQIGAKNPCSKKRRMKL